MTTTNPAMISTPALVLTVGTSLVPVASDVKNIFFRSDLRRKVTTRFLTLDFRAKQPELTEVETVARGKPVNNISYSQVMALTRENADSIQNGLRAVLHDLRSHEKLLEVGLGGKAHLPLDVMILADLAEPESAALPILLPYIHALLTDEPYAKVHLLLSIAVFSENSKEHANTYETLNALYEILENKQLPCLPQIYLFDRYKEGVWEAYDMGELQTILGNFVLALLSGGLAQRLAHQVAQLDVTETRAYFCSASATALIFDAARVQQACIMRLGAEILAMEFHSKIIPDPIPAEEIAADFCLNYANPQIWISRLCRDALFHSQGETGIELHFSDLQFEDVPMEDWARTIQAYDDHFKERQYPIQTDLVLRNAAGLKEEFLDHSTRLIQSLPQQPRLYPGGVEAARRVLERIQKNILKLHFDSIDPVATERDCNQQIRISLETLERAMQSLPKPPTWLVRLPGLLRKPAIQLFNLLFLYRELKTITDLRQNSVRLVEQKYEVLIKEVIHQGLNELARAWVMDFDRQKRSLKRLQSSLDKLLTEFKERTKQAASSPSLFRLSALDEAVLAWAYYQGKRPQDGFRHALLGEHGFLREWPKSNSQSLQEGLERFCSEVYQPLSKTDLEEALHHRHGGDADSLAHSLMQGSVPLLRPNFDQTGSGTSFQLRFLQCNDPSCSSLYPTFKADEQEWEYVNTDDVLIATCCRVRMMIPVTALTQVLERRNTTGGRS